MTSKKILVVDDSAFMRAIISDLIAQDSSFSVAGTARNGIEAIEQVKLLEPDAVTLDVEMPVCNGLEALKTIMKECPKPVIMLSSLSEEGGRETIEALENGAFDFVCKPSPTNGAKDINKVGEMLLERLHAALKSTYRNHETYSDVQAEVSNNDAASSNRSVKEERSLSKSFEQRLPQAVTSEVNVNARISKLARDQKNRLEVDSFRAPKTSKHPQAAKPASSMEAGNDLRRSKTSAKQLKESSSSLENPSTSKGDSVKQKPGVQEKSDQVNKQPSLKTSYKQLLAIGTSTGGPRALKEVLSMLPGSLEAPVLIVQHMPPNFTKSLAERLNTYCELDVKEAEQGDELLAGRAYLAPGGQHMTVIQRADGKLVIDLNHGQPRSGHRPSVDTMFDSLYNLTQYHRHLVLLTGMGSDGARSMKALFDGGVTSTFAESEQSCIVYGMPRAAVEMGCVKHIVHLKDMAKEIVKAMD